MVSTAPPRQPRPQVETLAAAGMPVQPRVWIVHALGAAAAGLAGYGFLGVIGQDTPPSMLVLIAGLAAGAAIATIGIRTDHRASVIDALIWAVAGHLGVRQLDRSLIVASRWRGGWIGAPRRLRIQHAVPDPDAGWKAGLITAVNASMGYRYEAGPESKRDRRRRVLRLQLVTNEPAVEQIPAMQQRATKTLTDLIGPTAKVLDATVDGEQLRSITIEHHVGTKLAAAGYRYRIERTFSAVLPGRWRARWELETDRVRFEVRPTLPECVWLPPRPESDREEMLRNYRSAYISCGVDEDGEEIRWWLAREPQALVTGGTGTGKTSLAHAIVAQLTSLGLPVWIGDAKRVEFLEFRDWPNVQIVAGTIESQVAMINAAHELMEHRYHLRETGQARIDDFEPLVVFLDEFTEFRSELLDWYATVKAKGSPSRPPTLNQVASLARKARTARIHLVVALQRPDAELLSGEMRENFSFRTSMGRLSAEAARMMWNDPTVGVTLPRGRVGRAMAPHPDGRIVEAQCYRFPELPTQPGTPEHDMVEQHRPTESRWPRLLPVPAEEAFEGDELTFRDYQKARWVLATERPDLDPLLQAADEDAEAGRALASPLAALGLVTSTASAPRPLRLVADEPSAGDDDVEEPAAADVDDGYLDPEPCSPHDLNIGDLVDLEDGVGGWGVLDETPEPDPTAPGMVALSWRGDSDESGSLSVPDGQLITVRRQQLEKDDEQGTYR